MFDFLKKKIGGFIDNLTKKEEKKEEKSEDREENKETSFENEIKDTVPSPENIEVEKKETVVEEHHTPKPIKIDKPATPKADKKKDSSKLPEIKKEREVVQERKEVAKIEKNIEETHLTKTELRHKKEIKEPEPTKAETKEQEPKLEKERIRLSAISAIKGFITREVEISENDVKELLDNFELELLEADVDLSVAETIKEELRTRLVGSIINKEKLHSFVGAAIKEALFEIINNENAFDIVEKVKTSEKPVKIMFLGINGAGKTTTIAKIAKLLMNNKQKVVFAAADTFRAAAIEQMAVHAQRLEVRLIKRDYGSDPTSVAYDAVNYAKAHGIDAVLIDTAGRQDTNISLLNEMKKMNRIITPDLKIYIGESIAGNAIIEQISAFKKEIGIDAVILTKLDCDPKGGTMLSINKTTGVPIVYIGTGQSYEDIEKFDPTKMVERIVE